MLGILWKILCVLGWCLLFLIILLIVMLLLVLFYPVSYRIAGKKDEENLSFNVRAAWLAGLLRFKYDYPSPGRAIVKVLGITVFDSGKTIKKEDTEGKQKIEQDKEQEADNIRQSGDTPHTESDLQSDEVAQPGNSSQPESEPQTSGEEPPSGTQDAGITGRIRAVWEKILYTIRNVCDKIKKIYESLDYYAAILREEDTKQLFSHVWLRVSRILKSIRPRKIVGSVHFGTGSPDTTGYCMALYGMLSPYLGQNLTVTPDFDDKVLEGQLSVKGRIVLAVLGYHGLRAFLDRRLHYFIKKMKREVK